MPEIDWVLRRVRLADGEPLADVALAGGRIVALAPDLPLAGREEWDLQGRVALPGLVDARVHLDRALLPLGGPLAGDEGWRAQQPLVSFESYLARGRQALRQAVLAGTVAMRVHVEAAAPPALEAALQLKDEVGPWCELQVVAVGRPGAGAPEERALAAAVAAGADLIGAAPGAEPDPLASIDAALELAERHGTRLDLTLEEGGAARLLGHLARRVAERGFAGVAAGPFGTLGPPGAEREELFAAVAEARLDLIAVPASTLLSAHAAGRPAGPLPLRELRDAGVNVCAASGEARSPVNPYGRFDPLLTAQLAGYAAGLDGPDGPAACLGLVTSGAAQALRLEGHGLFEGGRADLTVLRARSVSDAVTGLPERLALFRDGQRLFLERTTHEWAPSAPSWLW